MIKIGLVGATGQMGHEIIAYLGASQTCKLSAAAASENNPSIGLKMSDIFSDCNSDVVLSKDILSSMSGVDVIIDSTNKEALSKNLHYYQLLKKPLIIATTNFSNDIEAALLQLSASVPICVSSNFSTLFNDLLKMLLSGVNNFSKDLDVYIIETHGKKKKDKPSGTALMLNKVLKNGMNIDKIDIHSIRAGGISGVHEVGFVNEYNEKVLISYSSGSRVSYAKGIIMACESIVRLKSGYFTFNDLLTI